MSSIITAFIGASTLLHQSLLLVRGLGLLTPLRCLILSVVLLFIALLLCLMHGLWVVLGWGIDCHQFQRLGLAGVDELVLGAGWNNDHV